MEKNNKTRNWVIIILVLLAFYLVSGLVANTVTVFKSDKSISKGNIAIVPLHGVITIDGADSFTSSGVSSTSIISLLEKADEDDKIKAILLEINSPGGSAVASEEIAKKIKALNKTVVAWIREVGASGAYWAASAADHIIASRMSATGSIGVLSSYLEFAGLLQKYNVTYQRLVAGKHKDIGNPFRELTSEEKEMIEERLEKVHSYFMQSVAENRNMPPEKIKEFATGLVFLGEDAFEIGLVDEIGGKDEAIEYIEKRMNITAEPVTYEKKKSFLDILSSLTSRHGYYSGLAAQEYESLIVKT